MNREYDEDNLGADYGQFLFCRDGVIWLGGGETVHNAFPARSYKEGKL